MSDLKNSRQKAQAALEYMLLLTVVAVVVFIALKPSTTEKSVLNRAQEASEGYYNSVTRVIMGDTYVNGNVVQGDPNPINGGWCKPKPNGVCECACPAPAFGGAYCVSDGTCSAAVAGAIKYCGDGVCNDEETCEPGYPKTCFEDCNYCPDCSNCGRDKMVQLGCAEPCDSEGVCDTGEMCYVSNCATNCVAAVPADPNRLGYMAECRTDAACGKPISCLAATLAYTNGCSYSVPDSVDGVNVVGTCGGGCTGQVTGRCISGSFSPNATQTGCILPTTTCPALNLVNNGCTYSVPESAQGPVTGNCVGGCLGTVTGVCSAGTFTADPGQTGVPPQTGCSLAPNTCPAVGPPPATWINGCQYSIPSSVEGPISGTCEIGCTGSVTGTCNIGIYALDSAPFGCTPSSCPARDEGVVCNGRTATLPGVDSGVQSVVSCPSPDCIGSLQANCSFGVLAGTTGACTPAGCSASDPIPTLCGQVTLPAVASGTTSSKICPPGCTGTLSAYCSFGVLGGTGGTCTENGCSAVVVNNVCGNGTSATLPAVDSGDTSTRLCSAAAGCSGGPSGGSLQAPCFQGNSGTPINPCRPASCGGANVSSPNCTGTVLLPGIGHGSTRTANCPAGCTGQLSAVCSFGAFILPPDTSGCVANTCSALPANASACANNLTPPSTSASYTLVGSCSAPSDCWATCNAGYTASGGACVPLPVCGDGNVDPGEDCDGGNLNGQTCNLQGFAGGGTLNCTGGCTFDTSSCTP